MRSAAAAADDEDEVGREAALLNTLCSAEENQRMGSNLRGAEEDKTCDFALALSIIRHHLHGR